MVAQVFVVAFQPEIRAYFSRNTVVMHTKLGVCPFASTLFVTESMVYTL